MQINAITVKKLPLADENTKKNDEDPLKITKKPSSSLQHSFIRGINYQNRINKNTKFNPLQCQYCGRVFSSRSAVTYHVKTHTGEGQFTCDVCSYKTYLKSNLKSHLRSHTGEKPFHCPYCDFKSAWKNTLKYHISTHLAV